MSIATSRATTTLKDRARAVLDRATKAIPRQQGTFTEGDTEGNKKVICCSHLLPSLVARIGQNCKGCPYHDTGPDPFGKDIIHWCGPFKERDGTRWLNIAELTACPKGKWGDVSKTVH